MVRPDNRVLEAIARLEHDPNFQIFIRWLEESREAERDNMEQSVDAHRTTICQGMSRALSGILESVKNARTALKKAG